MIAVKIDGTSYSLPERYSELSPAQQVDFAAALRLKTSYDCARTRVALSLLGLRVLRKRPIYRHRGEWRKLTPGSIPEGAVSYFHVLHGKTGVHLLSADDLLPLLDAVENLFSVDRRSCMVSPRLESAAPIPFIRLRWGKLGSYAQGLTDFTFNDFIDCETYLAQYYEGDPRSLYRFIARAYGRKPNRILTEKQVDRLATKVERSISSVMADAIRLNYEGQKVFLYSKFDRLLQGGSTGVLSSDAVFSSYCRLVATLSGGNPVDHESIKMTLLYDALYALDERMRQIELNTLAHGITGI